METVTDILNWIATHWELIVATGVLPFVLLPVYELIKKLFNKHFKLVMIITVALSGLAVSAIDYLNSTPMTNPGMIWLQGAAVAIGTQPFYLLAAKPFKSWAVNKISESVQLIADKKNALEAEPATAVDFSQ